MSSIDFCTFFLSFSVSRTNDLVTVSALSTPTPVLVVFICSLKTRCAASWLFLINSAIFLFSFADLPTAVAVATSSSVFDAIYPDMVAAAVAAET